MHFACYLGTTNNQAKYEALLAELKIIKRLGVKCLRIFANSQLISSQATSVYKAQDLIMAKYLDKYRLSHQPLSTSVYSTYHDKKMLR